MINVLILGSGGNAGINFAKSLLMNGNFKVFGLDTSEYFYKQPIYESCYHQSHIKVEEKICLINKLCVEHDIHFIHGQPDPEVEFLTLHKMKLAAKTWDLNLQKLQTFSNKLACQTAWSKIFGTTETKSLIRCLENPDLFEDLMSQSGKVWIRAITGAGSRAALPVLSLDQAKSWADYWVDNRGLTYDDFMLAEYLPGEEYAVQTLWNNGALVSSQARERLQYFFGSIMPSGQSSTPSVAKTIYNRQVYDTAYKAIRSIDDDPHGIYCVDLKKNSLGKVVPMEVNYGRFFTTSDFFSSLGVNMPAMYCEIGARGYTQMSTKIEEIKDNFYWVRGLDRAPNLFKANEANELIPFEL